MHTELAALRDAARRAAPDGGFVPVGAVTVWRTWDGSIPMPEADSPCLCLVLDGVLRLHTPSGLLDYQPGQFSISQIDTPLRGTVLAPSKQGDFLAFSLAFTSNDVIEGVLALDNRLTEAILAGGMDEEEQAMADGAAVEALSRLFFAGQGTLWSDFLGRHLTREVLYYLLRGSRGRELIQSAARLSQGEEIYAANSWIKENFRRPFTVEELAERQGMSVSLFHQRFKSAVGMGPLQCQKRLRLTEARRLMLDQGRNVTQAAAEVGYESLSQFTRDYRKFFGASPKEDVQALRRRLEK